jgi:hypothetical protein
MLPPGRLMIPAFLKSCASALSNVASVRAPLTIAKANTCLSFDRQRLLAHRRSSSCRSLAASADLSLPVRSNCTSRRRTAASRPSSSLSVPAATNRGFPCLPRSQSVTAPLLARNWSAAFASTMRHTVRYPVVCALRPKRTGEIRLVDW